MALRPYDGRTGSGFNSAASSSRGVSGPPSSRHGSGGPLRAGGDLVPHRGGQMQQLQLQQRQDPFGADFFGGRDPFKEFGDMDLFGRGGGGMGGGMGGGLMGRDMMKRFDEMMGGMMQMPDGAAGGRGMAPFGGGGQYSCQTFVSSSQMGPDGKMHTERFVSSDIGNRDKNIRESQHAYQNSRTGIDKMGLERQLGDRGRKNVKERDRNTGEERSSEMFRGMDESGAAAFDRDFGGQAHHMPPHARFNAQMMQQLPTGAGGHAALPMAGGRQLQALSHGGAAGNAGIRHQSMPSSVGGRRR
eukprot:gnl/TRDRNA2_/TRDRNA2_198573_c0_seq1.p1 gnl/TRDRNA2_/TRDRNA2_198573_c0~~gnl/TRDRNA2_/TRDRNA2_198573_c0_seq1.p1  ORF type:complete len:301 (+),score=65.63 gnl/TRDRNA2_/TRDRNA2_198573_c0_seq1:46-948(+)